MNPLKVCPQCGTEYPANARFCEIDGTALRAAGKEASGDLVGSIIADRYHVMRKLGEGGMGQVYLVEHVKMGRKSALKVMHPGMVKDVDAISRFNREAANASRISHANVAAVYDFGETPDGIIYLAMEFVDGPPLTKLIQENGALEPRRAAEIARQTAEALTVAHDMGIVHRDLKPDNIMIGRTRDGGDLVKVVDFGIAKVTGNAAQKVTKTGLVIGTPDYMSPEQLADDALDGRSDIYALGLVTFTMLTGKLPFPADSAQESMIMRLTDKPKTLAEMRPDIAWPAEVQAAMDKALERDAANRYQTAIEFGRDLCRAVERMDSGSRAAPEALTAQDSVPATRFAPPSAQDAPPPHPATVALPVPAAEGRESHGLPPRPVAPPKRKTMGFLIGGIAALLVIVAAVYAPIMRKSQSPTVATADSTPANPPSQSRDTTVVDPAQHEPQQQSRQQPQQQSQQSQRPAVDSAALVSHSTRPVLDVNKELSTAEAEARGSDKASARAALDRIAALAGHLEEAGAAARAAVVKFEAYATLDSAGKACEALRDVENRVRGTSYQRKVDDRLATCP